MNPLPAGWPLAVRAACLEAGRAILRVREGLETVSVERKADDSPVSRADREASAIVGARLAALDPRVPVVCEEAGQDPGGATRYWVVDPLDGTREFLRGSPVFTVNVALVHEGRPVFGVVHAPVGGYCWWGGQGLGAWRDDAAIRALVPDPLAPRIVLSPQGRGGGQGRFLRLLQRRFPGAALEYLPGALKFCRLAEGDADFYPRSSPSCAWDTAAGQAVLEAAGGAVYGPDWKPLRCVAADGWRNGELLAVGDGARDWQAALESAA